MNRKQALAEARRLAERQHGTLVHALTLILDGVFAEAREYAAKHATAPGSERHVGYLMGADDVIIKVEDALYEAFNVQPDDSEPTPLDRLPAREARVDLTRSLWEVVVGALDEDATADQRMEARLQLGLVAWDTWHTGPNAPRGKMP